MTGQDTGTAVTVPTDIDQLDSGLAYTGPTDTDVADTMTGQNTGQADTRSLVAVDFNGSTGTSIALFPCISASWPSVCDPLTSSPPP